MILFHWSVSTFGVTLWDLPSLVMNQILSAGSTGESVVNDVILGCLLWQDQHGVCLDDVFKKDLLYFVGRNQNSYCNVTLHYILHVYIHPCITNYTTVYYITRRMIICKPWPPQTYIYRGFYLKW